MVVYVEYILKKKEYNKAVEIFENNNIEEKCENDDMLFYNLMPYYGISLCFSETTNKCEKGNEIMMDLIHRVNKDNDNEIHVIHKKQIYRWYGYKLQYIDKDYENAIFTR